MHRMRICASLFVLSSLTLAGSGCTPARPSTPQDVAALRLALRRPHTAEQIEAMLRPDELSSIGEMAKIYGLDSLPIRGLGVVTGLGENGSDKAGVDPDFRAEAKKVLVTEEGRKLLEASEMVMSRDSSIVQMEGAVPAGSPTGTLFDVYVRPLDAAVSLENGYLHRSALRNFMVQPNGDTIWGSAAASAFGQVSPIASAQPGVIATSRGGRDGVVFDGGRYNGERILIITLDPKYSSGPRVVLIEYLLNRRFGGVGTTPGTAPSVYANAESTREVYLRIPPAYSKTAARYADVVKQIKGSYFYGPPTAEAMKKLAGQLATGSAQEKYQASVELEAIGPAAIEYLDSTAGGGDDRTNLYAGEALSFLNSASGPDRMYAAALSTDEGVRFEAIRFIGQLSGRRAVQTLREKVLDSSPRIALEAVKGLVASSEQAALQIRLAGFDLVTIPGTPAGLIVKSSGRPLVVVTGPGTALKGTVAVNVAGVGIGSTDEGQVGIVAGEGPTAETLTVDATTDNILAVLARWNPPFDSVKKVLQALEDAGNLPYKATWLD